MFKRSLALAALSVCALVGSASASVGLNFVGSNGNTTDTLTSSQSAGVVPQTNWNNLTGSNSSASTIVDSTGGNTPLSVSWTNGANNYDNSDTSGVAPSATNGDQILNNGGIWGATARGGGPTVTVSNIPYPAYNVIVTSLLDHGGTLVKTTLGSTTVYANQTQNPGDTGYIDGASPVFVYTPAVDTTGVGTPLADYAIFPAVTGSSFTVSEDIVSGVGTAANLSSIEIVPVSVPEPATLSVLGLVGAGMLLRRRRRA